MSDATTNWNLDPPDGFHGLRHDIPLRVYTRHMPHWRQDGATYFVTFRLADSLPANRLREIEGLRTDWERRFPPPQHNHKLQELAKAIFERVERWLDEGHGRCVLREPNHSQCVHYAMKHFHDERYELGASVVMPNHVHAVFRPFVPGENDVEDIIGSWKSFTARRINARCQSSGALWQEESYDRIIRDEGHLWNALQYIGRNPAKAGLSHESCHLWINPNWQKLGWTFQKG